MFEITVDNFDIHKICYSGQCFRMKEWKEDTIQVIALDSYLEVTQRDNYVAFSCTEEEYNNVWKSYFGLDDNYELIVKSVTKDDSYMLRAIEKGYGIRILRQDLWEMIVSFLISQQNNIPRIKKSIEMICERYGERKLNFRQEEYNTFPKPEILSKVGDRELRECNVGYRSKYILETAKQVAHGSFDLKGLLNLNYEDAKAELMKLYGVGIKVSECVCLYALHHFDAFPIDTHIQKVLNENYPNGFPFETYHGFAGPLQQYAFYYDLLGGE